MNRKHLRFLALSAALAAPAFLTPAHAQHVRWAEGQAYWSGPAYTSDPGAYFTSGQSTYDPQGYLSTAGRHDQIYYEIVHIPGSPFPDRCMIHKRVINTGFEFYHPYIEVCG